MIYLGLQWFKERKLSQVSPNNEEVILSIHAQEGKDFQVYYEFILNQFRALGQ